MDHQQWSQHVEQVLKEIKAKYPQSSSAEKTVMRRRLRKIRRTCNEMLDSWIKIEEQIALLLEEYPELETEEKQLEEEFYLDESIVRHFRQGQGYYGLTMYHEAQHYFQQVVDEAPDFLLGRLYLGLTLFQKGELVEAYRHLQIVKRMATHDEFIGLAYHLLGCVLVKMGKDEEAITQFTKVTEILPDHGDAWFNLGACYYRLKEYHTALPYFYHALSINDNDWESMYYLSSCYRHYKEWESVTYWRRASYEKVHHPQVIQSIAHDYEEMGQYEDAIYWYQRLLTHQPKSSSAYHGISWNLWNLGQKREAMLWLKKGLTLSPRDEDLLFLYVWMSLNQGELNQVKRTLSLLPRQLQQNPLWVVIQSRWLTQTGQLEEAAKISKQLIEHENIPARAMGHYQTGRTYLEMGKVADAAKHFEQAHHLITDWKDPVFFKGICHLLEGKTDLMQQCWNQLVKA
jgi:tetratricopeptide (TPR) repeat protein